MLGKRSDQRGLLDADQFYLDFVGRDTFYGFLAAQRGQLFHDEEFATLYVLDNGRPSVPPSLLATALLLQTHDRVSDEEAKERADFDMRWKVALGISMDERPFAKSTLQVFRAQLILHERLQSIFKKSLRLARQSGHLKRGKIKVALDTSHILGRGAVKDTYNLLADGIVKLVRALATLAGVKPEDWGASHDLGRYFGSSLKGEARIDWEDAKARQQLLSVIVADADRLLEVSRQELSGCAPGGDGHKRLMEAAGLLGQLLLQDIERTSEGVSIKEGTARDRVLSVHDPEMRYGHKSKSKRFEGHKAALVVDTESGLITAAAVLAGNASDNEQALALVEQTEENAEVEVEEAIGDCAYGDGETRQEFADAGRHLVAKVPSRSNGTHLAKEAFQIDPVAKTCICPAGHCCSTLVRHSGDKGRRGKKQDQWGFRFAAAVCGSCPLRGQCVKAGVGKGRTVSLHPREGLLQEARAFQRSAAFAPYRRLRQVAEHRIARLMQLGVRQARYFGRVKTLGQLLLAATVANLTLIATKMGLMRGPNGGRASLIAQTWGRVVAYIAEIRVSRVSMACRLGTTHDTCLSRTGSHLSF
jgi:transposase